MTQNIDPVNSSNLEKFIRQALQEYKAKNYQEVEKILDSILAENPDYIQALKLRAMLSHRLNNLERAIADYTRITVIAPEDVTSYQMLGTVYRQLEDYGRAIDYFQLWLQRQPDSLEASKSLAYCLSKQGRLAEAIEQFNQILILDPNDIQSRWNRSLTLLQNGNYEEGFADFESRQYLPSFRYFLDCPQPLWDGADLDGKKILIHNGDDGFGDIMQFIRYAALVAKKGGRVIFPCPKPLFRLFKNVAGIEQLVDLGSEPTDFDVYIPLLSLPNRLRTTLNTIPVDIPYLDVPENTENFGGNLPTLPETRLKIGIVWSSGHRERTETNTLIYRDCPLRLFINLLSLPGIALYSLQVGQWAREVDEYAAKSHLYDLTPQITDFADTAAFISQLDLVISVDTAVVHLAGAMGKPVWTLLAFDPDWRWLRDRTDSPWYPTMRLFRQQKPGDWESVFEQVVPALEEYLANHDT